MFVPTLGFAQASIAGLVRDSSGAVLPGVTVEASSTVLIERVRSAVTDGTGQYRIEDLRPGSYAVTFTLPGFSTVRREGIELTGSFTATVNAELRVSAVEETITVSGEAPTVDVRNARTQQTLNKDVISTLPTGGRTYAAVAFLVPGVNALGVDVGGVSTTTAQPTLTAHGSRTGEGRVQMDGFGIGSPTVRGGADRSQYLTNVVNTEETVVSTSGVSGEAENGGLQLNLVPREGGNTFRGLFLTAGSSGALQGSNYTQALKDRGLTAPQELQRLWDVNGLFGGPLMRDRLWFLVSASYRTNRSSTPGMYYNKNAHNQALWTYEPDLSRQAVDDLKYRTAALRLTWQVTPRNKINVFRDEQYSCTSCDYGGRPTVSPEAVVDLFGRPRLQQVTWTSPVTSRFLLDAGVSSFSLRWGSKGPGEKDPNLIQVTELAGRIPGLIYRGYTAEGAGGSRWNYVGIWRASASYITGAQSLKVGYIGRLSDTEDKQFSTFNLKYRFTNGVPNQLTMSAHPYNVISRRLPFAVYAQDQWTLSRLTLQGALRYDRSVTSFPDQQVGPTAFIPVPILFPAQDGVKFDDISPRVGAVYDLFGGGKTAVKVNLGRYVEVQDATGIGTDVNPLVRLTTAASAISGAAVVTSRSWGDANGDYVPNCDLPNPAANGECGPWDNQNFGKNVFSTSFDPQLTRGWGALPYNWFFSASIDHEIAPRVSGSFGYFRRWYGNFTVRDNRAVGPSNFDPFSVTAPSDPRLPGGGGYLINGLYDINPAGFGQFDNLVTAASTFGNQVQRWHGVDASVRARLLERLALQGSLSTGRTLTDNCDVLPKIDNPSRLYCRTETLWLWTITGFATYTIPRWDVQVSGTLLSTPGPELSANYFVPNAVVAPSLGRNLAGGAANVLVNLVEPGTMYGDRRNQIDVRIAKILRFGRTRTEVGLDVYNVNNSSFVPTYNLTYGPRWLTPTSLLPARFAQVNARFEF
jgi:hypothetical protein